MPQSTLARICLDFRNYFYWSLFRSGTAFAKTSCFAWVAARIDFMKKTSLPVTLICAASIAAGCNRQSSEGNHGTNSANNAVSATASNARQVFASGTSTNEVSTNYFAYDYSKKDAFVSEARMSLNDLNQRVANLSNRIATASESTKANLQETWQSIQSKQAELDRKYDGIKNASPENWNEAKAAFAKAYYDMKAYLKAGWDSVKSKL